MNNFDPRDTFLAELPIRLNSSLETKCIITEALAGLRQILSAEAATVFLKSSDSDELIFWALEGGGADLHGRRIPAGRGIAGWVIENARPLLVPDAHTDPRFFSSVDQERKFHTRDLLCIPLIIHSTEILGALQVLNSAVGFKETDLEFLVRCSHYIAPALDNARLYEQVVAQNEKLAALDRKKGEIAKMIAHEFRTPLSIIRTAAEVLTSGMLQDRDAQLKMAETLDKGVERLVRAVSQVSNLALVSREEIKLERHDIPVSELLSELAKRFAPIANGRKLVFNVDDRSSGAIVNGDHGLLSVALGNLISNAIRFTPDQGSVSLAAERELGFVVFSVTDTGIGIPPGEQTAVFEKFYEVQQAAFHSSGAYEFRSCGLGLGLSTAQAILRAHGAVLQLESEIARGSRFWFRLAAAA